MQSRLQAKEQDKDPSFFGDAGFFVPVKLYNDYFAEANLLQHEAKVREKSLKLKPKATDNGCHPN
jgi:hypothetical protein